MMLHLADPSATVRTTGGIKITAPRTLACKANSSTQESTSRRAVLGLGALALAATPKPAHALFGFGGGKDEAAIYQEDTAKAINDARFILTVAKDDPGRDKAIQDYKYNAQEWVAKYRANKDFKGRLSYQDMYSVFNAISGHFNSFGANAPIPKKRLEVIMRELNEAEAFLAKGR